MPGYRSLSASFTGSAADSAREAEMLQREGDPLTAVALLEEALDASRKSASELPGWLCGRLASLYRSLGRFDDEVALLERYRESQTSEEARSRYDARLSKARTIAERKRRSESGALMSVRKVLGAGRRRATNADGAPPVAPPLAPEFQAECVQLLGDSDGESSSDEFSARLDAMLARHCAASRAANLPVASLVQALKTASMDESAAGIPQSLRDARYGVALVRLLATYFEEGSR